MQITRASGYRYRLFRRTPRTPDGTRRVLSYKAKPIPGSRRGSAFAAAFSGSGKIHRGIMRVRVVRVRLAPAHVSSTNIETSISPAGPVLRNVLSHVLNGEEVECAGDPTPRERCIPSGNAASCHGRRGGPGSRNEPSWETGERGSDVVLLLFATGRFSLPEARERKKESEQAHARRSWYLCSSRSTASP